MGRPPKNKTVEKEIQIQDTLDTVEAKETKKKIKELPSYVQLKVKSNTGNLFFKNDRNGNIVTWDKKNEIQFLSVEDIKHIKANQSRFLSENWISIVGAVDDEYVDLSIEEIYNLLTLQSYFKVTKLSDKFKEYISASKSELKSFINDLTDKEKELFKSYINSLDDSVIETLSHGSIMLLSKELGIIFDDE